MSAPVTKAVIRQAAPIESDQLITKSDHSSITS
jgi:hypothetical protein